MQFFYHQEAGKPILIIEGDDYRYLFKIRRESKVEELALRNMQDSKLYTYVIDEIAKKSATISLKHQSESDVMAKKKLHIGWCVIDPKTVEKTLPMLNEMGVAKISFVYCARSQKNFRLNYDRLEKIVINSSQQCGRSVMMEFEEFSDLDSYIGAYPQSHVLDFSDEMLEKDSGIQSVLIGCEGGFSNQERKALEMLRVIGLDSNLILKSESAVAAIAAKILL